MDPNAPRKSRRGVLVLCLVFIAVGIYLSLLAVGSFKSGNPVRGLTLGGRAYDWLDLTLRSIGFILVGAGGIWAVVRERRQR